MGFMDKVKAAASDVAAEAKKATAGAQTKIEQSQLRRKADDAARKLGYLVYAERMHGAPPAAEAESLVEEIAGLEAQIAAEETRAQAASTPPAPPPSHTGP